MSGCEHDRLHLGRSRRVLEPPEHPGGASVIDGDLGPLVRDLRLRDLHLLLGEDDLCELLQGETPGAHTAVAGAGSAVDGGPQALRAACVHKEDSNSCVNTRRYIKEMVKQTMTKPSYNMSDISSSDD